MKKGNPKDLERMLQECADLENFVELKPDGRVEARFRASSTARPGDIFYALGELYRGADKSHCPETKKQAVSYYTMARTAHLTRLDSWFGADVETYITLFLICDGLFKCGERSFSDGRDILTERHQYFEDAVKKYQEALRGLPERRKLQRYVINMRMVRLYDLIGQKDASDAAKKRARECLPLTDSA